MKLRAGKIIAALAMAATALTGCLGPTHSSADLERAADRTLDVVESSVPQIASALGARTTEINSRVETGGGSEGATPTAAFIVKGSMAGPEPSLDELLQVLEDIGFVDGEEFVPYGPTGERSVTGFSADGAVQIKLTYLDHGDPDQVISFTFRSTEEMRISNDERYRFLNEYAREVDQSLVAPKS